MYLTMGSQLHAFNTVISLHASEYPPSVVVHLVAIPGSVYNVESKSDTVLLNDYRAYQPRHIYRTLLSIP